MGSAASTHRYPTCDYNSSATNHASKREDRSRSIWTISQCDAAAEFHQEALVLWGAEVLLSQADGLVNVLGYIEAIRSGRLHGW